MEEHCKNERISKEQIAMERHTSRKKTQTVAELKAKKCGLSNSKGSVSKAQEWYLMGHTYTTEPSNIC
jgi:hypothetical protein